LYDLAWAKAAGQTEYLVVMIKIDIVIGRRARYVPVALTPLASSASDSAHENCLWRPAVGHCEARSAALVNATVADSGDRWPTARAAQNSGGNGRRRRQ